MLYLRTKFAGILASTCLNRLGWLTASYSISELAYRQKGELISLNQMAMFSWIKKSYSFGVHVHILWKPKLYSAVLLVAWNRWVLGHLQAPWSRPHIRTGSPPWCELFVAWSRPMASQNSVNIGSDNGLVPSGTKPLPEPVLANHQWGHMAFTWGQFHRKCSRYLSLISVGKWLN